MLKSEVLEELEELHEAVDKFVEQLSFLEDTLAGEDVENDDFEEEYDEEEETEDESIARAQRYTEVETNLTRTRDEDGNYHYVRPAARPSRIVYTANVPDVEEDEEGNVHFDPEALLNRLHGNNDSQEVPEFDPNDYADEMDDDDDVEEEEEETENPELVEDFVFNQATGHMVRVAHEEE